MPSPTTSNRHTIATKEAFGGNPGRRASAGCCASNGTPKLHYRCARKPVQPSAVIPRARNEVFTCIVHGKLGLLDQQGLLTVKPQTKNKG
jgi:hypothetical protein